MALCFCLTHYVSFMISQIKNAFVSVCNALYPKLKMLICDVKKLETKSYIKV
jgi:hypothetical protein